MDARLEWVINTFDLHTRLFKNAVFGMEEHRNDRLSPATNHDAWLAGHLVSTRYGLANMIGLSAQEPFPDLFSQGKAIDPTTRYPELNDQIESWDKISPMIIERLGELDAETLDGPAPFESPMGNTLISFIAFMCHHEAYHLGQMGFLRKYFGHTPLSYGDQRQVRKRVA